VATTTTRNAVVQAYSDDRSVTTRLAEDALKDVHKAMPKLRAAGVEGALEDLEKASAKLHVIIARLG